MSKEDFLGLLIVSFILSLGLGFYAAKLYFLYVM